LSDEFLLEVKNMDLWTFKKITQRWNKREKRKKYSTMKKVFWNAWKSNKEIS
jgi:hypothetical protein